MSLNNNLYGISGKIKVGKDLVGEMLQYIGDVENPNFGEFQNYINFDSKYEIKKCADKLKDCVCVILGCTRKQLEDRDYKEKELGPEWWRYTFDGVTINYLDAKYDEEGKKNAEKYLVKLTPRLILQLLGTQGGRMVVHPNIWVLALFSDYKKVHGKVEVSRTPYYDEQDGSYINDHIKYENTHNYPNWIITDVRFPENEGKAVSSRDGLLIGIKRLFRLRFPEYEDLIDATMDGYAIPEELESVNPELYKNLMHESETSMGDHSWCDVIIENNGTIEELFNNVLNAVQWEKELS